MGICITLIFCAINPQETTYSGYTCIHQRRRHKDLYAVKDFLFKAPRTMYNRYLKTIFLFLFYWFFNMIPSLMWYSKFIREKYQLRRLFPDNVRSNVALRWSSVYHLIYGSSFFCYPTFFLLFFFNQRNANITLAKKTNDHMCSLISQYHNYPGRVCSLSSSQK